MDTMKIAFTGNSFPFGPDLAYGGERILGYLAEALGQRGHEVYVFSRPGTVKTPHVKEVIPVIPLQGKDAYYEAVRSHREADNFDIYQCNYFGEDWSRETTEMYNYVELPWNCWCHIGWQLGIKPYNTIAYSKVLQNDFKERGMDTIMIHYGIPEDLYTFVPIPENYVVWIGKIEGGKYPKAAIELAKAAGYKILIIGPPYNTGCFWSQIAPYIDNETVFWARGANDKQKQKLMGNAKAFISSNDNTWKEHFGIVNAEALAMGVPIIAFNRINQDCAIKVDEIIVDSEQGFFLNYEDSNNLQNIIDIGLPLLQKIDQIDRTKCRKRFEENFTSSLMASRYEALYKAVIENGNVETLETA